MMRAFVAACTFALVASACGVGGGGSERRTVLVDFNHDEFASFMPANFPQKVTIAAGDALTFKQIWTGEPHTVTGGTIVDEMMTKGKQLFLLFQSYHALRARGVKFALGDSEKGKWADDLKAVETSDAEPARTRFLEAYDALVEEGFGFPSRTKPSDTTIEAVGKVFDEAVAKTQPKDGELPNALDAQNARQPCYLSEGSLPKDPNQPCRKAQRRQPVFNGEASWYSSGIIPYEGQQGNTFEVSFSPDIKPGAYFFFCAVHGPEQFTEVDVKPKGSAIPSQDAVSRRATKEIAEFAEPMLKAFRNAQDGSIDINGSAVRGRFAGVYSEVGMVNEFVPKSIKAKVGEKVTWKVSGGDHSISFYVPRYFPLISFESNGNVEFNPKVNKPAGGSPQIPEQPAGGVLRVDGGTYDGRGFFSSGVFGGDPYAEYSLRFSKPGSYRFACMIHPPMVGTLEVA